MQIKQIQNITTFNSLNLLSHASYYTKLTNSAQLAQIRDFINQHQLSSLVLGGGSNIILPELYKGLVIQNELLGIQLIQSNAMNQNQVLVKAYAGEDWDNFVATCVANNYYGLENLSLIPGKVGASPIQNIGAYGVEVKDYIAQVELYNLLTGQTEIFNNSQCEFDYRDSIFKRLPYAFVIISVTYQLSRIKQFHLTYAPLINKLADQLPLVTAQVVRDTVIAIRQSKLPDPKLLANAGSFFHNIITSKQQLCELLKQNPQLPFYEINDELIKIPSAYLIESLGLKGYRVGNLGIYNAHALVVVNYGLSNQYELLQFANMIISRVLAKYKLQLTIEPIIIN